MTNETSASKLPSIGHDRAVIQKLARAIFRNLPNGTMTTKLTDTADLRGFRFDVQITGPDGKPTGHIARVQITLDRFEQEHA